MVQRACTVDTLVHQQRQKNRSRRMATEVLYAEDHKCFDLDQTSITVDMLIDQGSPQDSTHPDQAQLQFNVQSQEQFLDLVYSHSISTDNYREIFLDTDNHLLMKNNIWVKRIVEVSNNGYSVKHSRTEHSLVAYTEYKTDSELKAKAYILSILKHLKLIGNEVETIEFKYEYAFDVSRYVLTPSDERYTITVDNVHYDGQVYTVCAVKTFCTEADILKLCREVEDELNSRVLTVGPVLSKILFYLYQKHRDIFSDIGCVKIEKYKLVNLQVFNMDCMYDYDNIVNDDINYDDIGYYGESYSESTRYYRHI
jgi:hypothetical protein